MEEASLEHRDKKPFDPSDPPLGGSRNYDASALNPEQKETLKKKLLEQRRENEKYFNDHPEIRGIVSLILRHLLERKPTRGAEEVQELVGTFFGRPRAKIAAELLNYLLEIKHQGALIDKLKSEIAEEESLHSED